MYSAKIVLLNHVYNELSNPSMLAKKVGLFLVEKGVEILEKMKKNIRRVFWLYFLLLFMLQVYLANFILVDSKDIITNANNPRLSNLYTNIKKGDILDNNETILADSIKTKDEYTREYKESESFVHVIGNSKLQKSGIESKYNFQLQKLDNEILNRLDAIMFSKELLGNSVVITIDTELQKLAYEKLGTKKGAIVAIEPSTGKILAMVSYPSYNPNTISENWEVLSQDEENSPLINRATQGLYPPGSVFKIVSAATIIRNIGDYKNYEHDCKGSITIDGSTINCYNNTVHGKVNLEKAVALSCNTYFALMSEKIAAEEFQKMANSLYFNNSYGLKLDYNKSSFVLDSSSSLNERMQTIIGQGKTLMTPLHIGMITSAIANGGIMMEPYIVDHIKTPNGKKIDTHIPRKLSSVFTSDESAEITKMMMDVVTYGTAKESAIKGIEVAGKTGTAQNNKELDHGLYTIFAPAEKPEIVVTVVLENIGSSSKAIPIGRDIIKFYLKSK